MRNYAIGIMFCKGFLDGGDLTTLTHKLDASEIDLVSREQSPYINVSLDFFIPFVQIMLSPEMVSAFYQGLLTNAVSDTIKWILSYIYKKFHKQTIYKLQNGEMIEQTANIHFVIGNNRFILPIEVDDKKYQYAVDKFMELAAKSSPTETTYTLYSEKDNSVLIKTENEIIREECKKHHQESKQ